MRSAPRKIDKKTMPSIADAAKMIQKTVDRPWQRLGDASIGSLVELFGDGTPVWLTGSSVWLTAVFGMPPDYGGDFDVVFSTKEATEKFVKGALSELNSRLPPGYKGFEATTNALGGSRILHPDGKGVIDAWHLGDNESIAELIMAYPGGIQNRCAYYISKNQLPSNLIRIVSPGADRDEDENDGLALSSYYGTKRRVVKAKTYDNIFASIGSMRYESSYPYDIGCGPGCGCGRP